MVYKRSENEIKMISKSCQIVADTINMLSEFVVPGALISDLDKKAENLKKRFKPNLSLEIGSNDGVFIKNFSKEKIVAVEPCLNLAKIC